VAETANVKCSIIRTFVADRINKQKFKQLS
jgi:hypothetical protein